MPAEMLEKGVYAYRGYEIQSYEAQELPYEAYDSGNRWSIVADPGGPNHQGVDDTPTLAKAVALIDKWEG